MWLSLLAAFVGMYVVYLAFVGSLFGLPHFPCVYATYALIEAVMSFWLMGRMGDHVYDLKVKRTIAYWKNYNAKNSLPTS